MNPQKKSFGYPLNQISRKGIHIETLKILIMHIKRSA
jgi:hypothetical protein